jgi:hypothetical protein
MLFTNKTRRLLIDDWTATNTRTGQTLAVTPIPAMLLEMMLGGGVLPMLEAKGLIAARV